MTFDDFWNLYPRKTNKGAARKAWAKLKPNEYVCDLIAMNISERLAAGEWQDKKFIPHPSTYLNGERWEDEVITSRSMVATDSTATKDRSLEQDLNDRSWAH